VKNASGEPFGLDRVCRLLETNNDKPAIEIHQRIWAAVDAWMQRQDDDITLLVVRRTK
jgi:serine phosphatase RsbU (regulator of sigma subunit)